MADTLGPNGTAKLTHPERLEALARVMTLLLHVSQRQQGLACGGMVRDGLGRELHYGTSDGTRLRVYVSDASGWEYLTRIEFPEGLVLTDRDLTRPVGWYVPSPEEQRTLWAIQ